MSYISERRSPSAQWQGGHPLDPRSGSSTLVYRGQGGKATDSNVYRLEFSVPMAFLLRCISLFRVGVYGWRKRCLYAMIILLTVVIIVNLAITVWIMKVLNFNLVRAHPSAISAR